MRQMIHRVLIVALLVTWLAPFAMASFAQDGKGAGAAPGQITVLENAYVRALLTEQGSVVIGTTGGDPSFSGDENKPLLFGYDFPSGANTGYGSVRIIRGGAIEDHILSERPRVMGPTMQQGVVLTRWDLSGVEVTQAISLHHNRYTNREDMVLIAYTLRNVGATPLQAGVRTLLDVQVGANDYAPFFIPGVGNIDKEREFTADMPEYYKAFESPTYADDSLRAQGLLRGADVTRPDRFVLATWRASRGEGAGIYLTAWDYAVSPQAALGDSAVALWWGPYDLAPGQEVQVQTGYGLGGSGGGNAWFDAPARLACPDMQFDAHLWISNTSTETLMNGRATLNLGQGLRLAGAQQTQRAIGDIPPGEVRSVSWRIEADLVAQGEVSRTFAASTAFDNLGQPLVAQRAVLVPACTPTPTATAPALPTATPPATTTPSPTPDLPEVPEPTTLVWLASGVTGLALYAWRRRPR